MRVLLATTQFAPELGGVPQLLWDFCRHRLEDIELRVLTVRQREATFYTSFDEHAPFPIERVAPHAPAGSTSFDFARRLREIVHEWKPAVIFSGVGYPTAIIVSGIAQLTGTPFVVYTHSEDVTIPNATKRRALSWALSRAAAVITVSDFTRRELARLNVASERVVIIPPGIDLDRFEPSIYPFSLASLRSSWVLMTVGRLVWRKGQDTIIRAMPEILKQVPNAHYLIVGDGPDARGLRSLTYQLRVAESVTFAGRVSDRDLPKYFFVCDAYVMPTRPSDDGSEVEGFGIVFLEAGAAGKPVIAGRAGGVADAVVDGETGLLVDPTDVRAVTDAILRLATDSNLCRQLGRNGRKRVVNEFSVERFAMRITHLLTWASRK